MKTNKEIKQKQFNKGDIVKVLKGPFKDFLGEFIEILPDEIGRIKVEMYGKLKKVNFCLENLRKVIPKCPYCKKILNFTLRELNDSRLCKKCFKDIYYINKK